MTDVDLIPMSQDEDDITVCEHRTRRKPRQLAVKVDFQSGSEDEDDITLCDQRIVELETGRDGVLPAEVSAMLLKGDSRLKAAVAGTR